MDITAELERLGIRSTGSIERQKERLERLTKEPEDLLTHIAALMEEYRWQNTFGGDKDEIAEIYIQIEYRIKQLKSDQ
jgi:hypothetical protein